jgi:hypothetical protein
MAGSWMPGMIDRHVIVMDVSWLTERKLLF